MAEKEIEVGDVVILKSGGPQMTVQQIDDDWASTSWFDKSERLQEGRFIISSLEFEE